MFLYFPRKNIIIGNSKNLELYSIDEDNLCLANKWEREITGDDKFYLYYIDIILYITMIVRSEAGPGRGLHLFERPAAAVTRPGEAGRGEGDDVLARADMTAHSVCVYVRV